MGKRSIEERLAEFDEQRQKCKERMNVINEREKRLIKQQKIMEAKQRTHRLIKIGGMVESVLGRSFEEEDYPELEAFLRREGKNGSFFLNAMQHRHNM